LIRKAYRDIKRYTSAVGGFLINCTSRILEKYSEKKKKKLVYEDVIKPQNISIPDKLMIP